MAIREVRVILTCPERNYALVKIVTEDGITGVGDGTLNGNEATVAQMITHMSELIIGADEDSISDIWQLLYHWGYWRNGPIFKAALAAIDLALWDIKGKKANMPVYQLLGGRSRQGAMVYGHAHGDTPQEVEEMARGFIEQGYQAVRAQPGGSYGIAGKAHRIPPSRPGLPPTEIFEPTPYIRSIVPMFEHLRLTLGEDIELLHDVHEQLTPIQAAGLAKSLEPFRLFFLEDPVRPEHLDGLRLVRQHSVTPIAIGELFTGREPCIALCREGLIDYLRIAPMHVGGITEAVKICAIAEAFAVKTAFHGAADMGPIGQAAALSLDIVIPNFGVQEWVVYPDPVFEVLVGACKMRNGYANPNEAPGWGIDIDEEAAARFPYQPNWMPLNRRKDGTVHLY